MTPALVDLLVPALERSGGQIAGTAGERVEAGEILAGATASQQELLRAGVVAGERVLVLTANRPGDLAAFLAVWLAGAVVVPLDRDAPPAVRDQLRRRTGARIALNGDEMSQIAEGRAGLAERFDDAALIVFTSGTTGRPKGVVHGHARFRGKLEVLGRLLGLGPRDHVVLPLQLTFIFGIWVALLSLVTGASLTLLPRFGRSETASALKRTSATLAAVPTMLRIMLTAEHCAPPQTILTGGELLPKSLARTLRASWPEVRIFDLYGLSETGSCDFCLPPDHQPDGLGSIGHPTAGVAFRIVSEDARKVATGGTGELEIKTPFGMLGYFDDSGLDDAAFHDGFFRTGDLARERPSGMVEIVGRRKEIITRGGNKIAPAEIEAVLEEHPAVAAALCGGVEDALLGQTVHVLVVPDGGVRLDPASLEDWARSKVERYKLWDGLHIVPALPVGPTGKLDRSTVARFILSDPGKER